jgi:hydrogenase maturation protease
MKGGPVVVLGLGNVLMQDDGVGVHAAWALMRDPPAGCEVIEVGTASLSTLDDIERAGRVIAIDAVETGHPPGTVVRFELDEGARPAASSLHDLGIAGVLSLLPPAARPRAVVVGIVPERIATGLELSETVSAALPRLLDAVRAEVLSQPSAYGPLPSACPCSTSPPSTSASPPHVSGSCESSV